MTGGAAKFFSAGRSAPSSRDQSPCKIFRTKNQPIAMPPRCAAFATLSIGNAMPATASTAEMMSNVFARNCTGMTNKISIVSSRSGNISANAATNPNAQADAPTTGPPKYCGHTSATST